MTFSRSHATHSRWKQLASAPTTPNSVGNIWREHFPTDKRYRGGENEITDSIITCRMPSTSVLN